MSPGLRTLLILSWLVFAAARRAEPRPALFESEDPALTASAGPLDDVAFRRLEALDIEPARPCSDAVFLRRVYLDVTGTLPTADQARAFLDDRAADKRAVLVDALLETPGYADYQAMRWAELLRVKSEYPINLWPNAVQAYHRWIRTALAENRPYDRFVAELLTASGSNFRKPPVNFLRAVQNREPAGLAQAVALTFLGSRIETWPAERRDGLAAFFSRVGYKTTLEWKEEIVYFDPAKPLPAAGAVFPDGARAVLDPDRDPREALAAWLAGPGRPWLARALVNRVWAWLVGRGIVYEPDDIRPDNPPVNPELLAVLEREFLRSGCDLKALYRLILVSRTYQLSPVPRADTPEAVANFAYHPVRLIEAEVLIDALNQITGTTEKYSSPIPEPFTVLPEDQRAVAIADGSISSPFLEQFGRPARDTGRAEERSRQPTAGQRLHLLNSSHIQRKLEQSARLRSLLQKAGNPADAITAIYLAILSRRPTPAELRVVGDYAASGRGLPREAALDLAWALINSREFLCQH